jgi:hypothetical protein
LVQANFWLCGYPKVVLEGSSLETAEGLQEKVTDIVILISTSIFRAVFEEWKNRLLRCIEAGGEYLHKHPFSSSQRYTYFTRGDKPGNIISHNPYISRLYGPQPSLRFHP